MEPLLLAGYSAIFVALFAYLTLIRRRIDRLEQRVEDFS